jgi:hypothetical protein
MQPAHNATSNSNAATSVGDVLHTAITGLSQTSKQSTLRQKERFDKSCNLISGRHGALRGTFIEEKKIMAQNEKQNLTSNYLGKYNILISQYLHIFLILSRFLMLGK